MIINFNDQKSIEFYMNIASVCQWFYWQLQIIFAKLELKRHLSTHLFYFMHEIILILASSVVYKPDIKIIKLYEIIEIIRCPRTKFNHYCLMYYIKFQISFLFGTNLERYFWAKNEYFYRKLIKKNRLAIPTISIYKRNVVNTFRTNVHTEMSIFEEQRERII